MLRNIIFVCFVVIIVITGIYWYRQSTKPIIQPIQQRPTLDLPGGSSANSAATTVSPSVAGGAVVPPTAIPSVAADTQEPQPTQESLQPAASVSTIP